MTRAGAGILIDALLHQKGGILVDERHKVLDIADGTSAEEV
jgi:hypothetical protein